MAIFRRNKKENTEPEQNEQRQPTNDEQMMRRQSAPRPTVADALAQHGQGMTADGAINGFKALAQVIGREQVQKANLTLQKYKEGKANLNSKSIIIIKIK